MMASILLLMNSAVSILVSWSYYHAIIRTARRTNRDRDRLRATADIDIINIITKKLIRLSVGYLTAHIFACASSLWTQICQWLYLMFQYSSCNIISLTYRVFKRLWPFIGSWHTKNKNIALLLAMYAMKTHFQATDMYVLRKLGIQ